MICIIHGYLLDGSGSNLWTQSIIRTLCRAGQTVHLMCQEPHPDQFDFVARAICYDDRLQPSTLLEREVPYTGRCIMHKPTLGEVLPVYVWDRYEEFDKVVPMVELEDAIIDDYIQRNVAVLEKVVSENDITSLHVNHAVLMSVVTQRVAVARGIPFTIMPHGSAIEYAVKKDARLHRLASEAFDRTSRIFVIGPEIRQRVSTVFSEVGGITDKLVDLNLGVDTSLFQPIEPAERRSNIAALEQTLQGVERGKRPELTQQMRHCLSDSLSREEVRKVLTQSSDYTAMHTDTDCEAKLAHIDWEQDSIILFVGRLIASKGIHGLVAALPQILAAEPRARLLVVGHGPLREPLEAMLWALDTGNRELFESFIEWGHFLEGAREPEPFEHLKHYLSHLARVEMLDSYFDTARKIHVSERVTFCGYLTHLELRYLFPCCDVAVFPSIVAEAGPLVFLEAMASGVFPMGIYFAGMATSIDSAAEVLPHQVTQLMKLRRDPVNTVVDIVSNVTDALALDQAHAADLRRVAVERFDWAAVGRRLVETLQMLEER